MRKFLFLLTVLMPSVVYAQLTPEDEALQAELDAIRADAQAQIRASSAAIRLAETAKIDAAWQKYADGKTPPDVSLAFDKSEIDEDDGQTPLVVRLSKKWKNPVTVEIGFSGTAGGDDYEASATTLTIPAGQEGAQIIIRGKSDDLVEPQETIIATISSFVGAKQFVGGDAKLLINSYDLPPPPTVSYAFDPTTVAEGKSADLIVTLSKAWVNEFVIDLTFRGTAGTGDYDAPPRITFAVGETRRVVPIQIIDDSDIEDDETLMIGDASLTIVSDDVQPPPVDPPPTTTYKIRPDHPRLYWHSDIRQRLLAAPKVLSDLAAIADTDADTRKTETPLDCAALWLLSKEGGLPPLPPPAKYKYTAEQYRDRAISKALVMAQTQINLAGTHYEINHLHPLATLYDWLYNDMTDAQRATIRATLIEALSAAYTTVRYKWAAPNTDGFPQIAVDAKGDPVKIPVQNPNRYWAGYNQDSGAGMTVAIAVYGETTTDWVQKYWDENWWAIPPPEKKGIGGFYNREYERNWLVGGGNNEDWGYLGDQLGFLAVRHAWQTATGDFKSLNYPFLSDVSLLYLHQCVALPYNGKPRLKLMPTYANGNDWMRNPFWLAGGTGDPRPQVAAISAWLLTQVQYAGQPAFDEFFWRCIVGDPRVKPKTPVELGLISEYYVQSTGLYYDRSDWTDGATRVFFGCSEQMYRATASGNVMIWSGGLPLIADRSGIYAHGYSGPGRAILPMIRVAATGKIVVPLSGDDVPRRVKVGSFKKVGNAYVADLTQHYPGVVTRMLRTFEYDRDTNTITITDECVPKPGYVPMSSWPTPLRPVISDSSVTFSNGQATAEMTWDATPAEVTFRGGETDNLWAEEYDRTLYNVAGTAEWQVLPRDQQILAGGFYTVYVTATPVDGVYRIVTTIRVSPLGG
jgi:hypothetical protein